MLLEGENAVIYGGATGGAGDRTLATLDVVANEIRSGGGVAETARVDAFDERRGEENAGA
jgi:hypothetical protein